MKFTPAILSSLVTLTTLSLVANAEQLPKPSFRGAFNATGSNHRRLAGYGEGCWLFDQCTSGLSCHPWIHKCYHHPRRENEPCSAGFGCGSGFTCEAGSHVCRAPGRVGDACHLTRPCGSGLSCQPGVHKCYHSPRRENEPCVAGHGCGDGLFCEAASHVCRAPGKLEDPCHATRPCGDGLSCQPGVHQCYHSPRQQDEPCVAGHECGDGLFCEAVSQICRLPGKLGEYCHVTRPCGDDLSCIPIAQQCAPSDCAEEALNSVKDTFDLDAIFSGVSASLPDDKNVEAASLDSGILASLADPLDVAVEAFASCYESFQADDDNNSTRRKLEKVDIPIYLGVTIDGGVGLKSTTTVALAANSQHYAGMYTTCAGAGLNAGGSVAGVLGFAFHTDDIHDLAGESNGFDADVYLGGGAGFGFQWTAPDDDEVFSFEVGFGAGKQANIVSYTHCWTSLFGVTEKTGHPFAP